MTLTSWMFQETPRFLASHTTEFNRPPRAMVDVDSTNSANIRLYKNFEAQGSWAKTFGLWGKKFCKVGWSYCGLIICAWPRRRPLGGSEGIIDERVGELLCVWVSVRVIECMWDVWTVQRLYSDERQKRPLWKLQVTPHHRNPNFKR